MVIQVLSAPKRGLCGLAIVASLIHLVLGTGWAWAQPTESFGEEASLVIVLPRAREDRFRQHLLDLTGGKARFEE